MCPHQMPALIEVKVLEMRRSKPFWGPLPAASSAENGVRPPTGSSRA